MVPIQPIRQNVWRYQIKQVKIDLKEMLRKRSVGVNIKTTFPAQALP
jgi:hypothetical protein